MHSRRDIVPDHSEVHVYFRCSEQRFFLEPAVLKDKLLQLLAKYKSKYRVKIFDFCIMDNHAHLYMWTPNSEALGNFMRTVLSQQAQAINKYFGRSGQAFSDRYCSPVICSPRYSLRLIKYIYANRVKVDHKLPPDQDPYCSASWRLRPPYKIIENPKNDAERLNNALAKLIDNYIEPSVLKYSHKAGFLRRMIEMAIKESVLNRDYGLYNCSHTIGSPLVIAYRKQVIRAARRERGPPILGVGTSSAYPRPR